MPQERLDLADKLLGPIRLGDEMPIIGNVGRTGLGLSGRQNELHMRPAFMDAARQLHSIQGAGHVNVGKQQPHLWGGLENIECGLSIGRFDDTKSLILKDVGCQ